MAQTDELKTYVVFGLKEDGESGEVLGVIDSHHINKAIEEAQANIDKKSYERIKVIHHNRVNGNERELFNQWKEKNKN